MWGGRFALGPSEALDALNRSLPVDHRLWPQDVFASKAWVHALCRAGVVTSAEETLLLEGLDRVADKLADGAAVGAPDEDVHTLVERLLYAEVGAVAGKLHTGRSRNDQVATDLRLWTLTAIDELDAAVAALGRTLVAKAKDGLDTILPGYTHGQRAQPVRWAYVLLLAPFIGTLWVSTFAAKSPRLFGFPFFYWYQLAWVIAGACITAFVYLVTTPRRGREEGGPR